MSTLVCDRMRSILLLLLLLLAASPACAENAFKSEFAPSQPPLAATGETGDNADPIQVPSGGRPLVVARPEAIPRQLRAAIERAQCGITGAVLAKYPVLIFRPADGRLVMAVATCSGRLPDSRAFLFERSVEREPTPMTFPVIGLTSGISASRQPGLLSWDAQTRTLTAWRGSDHCPAQEVRHVYRQWGGELNGFTLSRIEQRQLRCTQPEAAWQTLWQAPAWNLQP